MYKNDNYLKLECQTKIKKIYDDNYYEFEETIFYPEKGGMLADTGTINDLEVVDLKFENDIVLHKVNGELKNPIKLKVDKKTRLNNTIVQSAFHILDGYYLKKGHYIPAIGVNPNNQWFEVDDKSITWDDLNKLELYMEEVINSKTNTTFSYVKGSLYDDPRYQKYDTVRIVEFGDYDKQPCGTLHINNTSEINNFIILDYERTARGTKVYVSCGIATFDRLKDDEKLIKNITNKLGFAKSNILEEIDNLNIKLHKNTVNLEILNKELLNYKAKDIVLDGELINILDDMNSKDLNLLAKIINNDYKKDIILLSRHNNITYLSINTMGLNAKELYDIISKDIPFHGGGNPKIVSASSKEDINVIYEKIKDSI